MTDPTLLTRQSPSAPLSAGRGPLGQFRAGRLARRLPQLCGGLVLYGLTAACLIRSRLGNSPWDVLHQGIAGHLAISIGTVTIAASVVVLLAWVPLREMPGLGTLSNAAIVGLATNLGLAVLPGPHELAGQIALMAAGIAGNAVATAMYIGARFGPGPRDGLMTGLHRRTGRPIWVVRTSIEVSVVVLGWLLGGVFGVGTVLYAAAIGPLVQRLLPLFSVLAGRWSPLRYRHAAARAARFAVGHAVHGHHAASGHRQHRPAAQRPAPRAVEERLGHAPAISGIMHEAVRDTRRSTSRSASARTPASARSSPGSGCQRCWPRWRGAGHARCVLIAAEVFGRGDDDRARVLTDVVPPETGEAAGDAVLMCPEPAIMTDTPLLRHNGRGRTAAHWWYPSSEECVIMRVPQVNERVKEAPAHALRAMFAGIGQLLSVSDKLRNKTAATKAPADAESAAPAPVTPEPAAAAPAAPESTMAPETPAPEPVTTEPVTTEPVAPEPAAPAAGGHVKLLPPEETAPAPGSPAAPAAPVTPAATTAPEATSGAAAPADLPLANYDDLSIASLRARLRNLTADQLAQLVAYEKSHAGRADVISMFERRIAKLAEG